MYSCSQGLKDQVLKQVLVPQPLALAVPQPPRAPRPEPTKSVTTPAVQRPANGQVPMGTTADSISEDRVATQGSAGQASADVAQSVVPHASPVSGRREALLADTLDTSGAQEAPLGDPPTAGGAQEALLGDRPTASGAREPHEDGGGGNGSCEGAPEGEKRDVAPLPNRARKKKVRSCAQCGVVKGEGCVKLLECSGCRNVLYCGRKCQATHWPIHKRVCRQVEEID